MALPLARCVSVLNAHQIAFEAFRQLFTIIGKAYLFVYVLELLGHICDRTANAMFSSARDGFFTKRLIPKDFEIVLYKHSRINRLLAWCVFSLTVYSKLRLNVGNLFHFLLMHSFTDEFDTFGPRCYQ